MEAESPSGEREGPIIRSAFAAVEPDRATAVLLDEDGAAIDTAAGEDAPAAIEALAAAPGRVLVADDTVSPTAAAVAVVDFLSVQSARRALALAGCEILETISIHDGLSDGERSFRLVEAEPRLILLAGGTDGGDDRHLGELAEVIAEARSFLLSTVGYDPAILYAGNPDAAGLARRALVDADVRFAENVRPSCERENLLPAVLAAASLARLPEVPPAREVRPAGAARSAAVLALSRVFEESVLLLHTGARGAEAVSLLEGHWNRVVAPSGDLGRAVIRHREEAREMSGVALDREIADAFAKYVPGRDLLDVAPPGLIVGSGPEIEALPAAEAATLLVDLARPRGAALLVRAGGGKLTALGLASLLEHPVGRDTWESAVEKLAVAVSLDGPADAVRVDLPTGEEVVEAGEMRRFPLDARASVLLDPVASGDLGAGRRRKVVLDLPALPGGLIVDARGTPVPPERRTRILPVR